MHMVRGGVFSIDNGSGLKKTSHTFAFDFGAYLLLNFFLPFSHIFAKIILLRATFGKVIPQDELQPMARHLGTRSKHDSTLCM